MYTTVEIGQAVLVEAAKLISGERQVDYGTPQKNLERIAAGWEQILDVPIRPDQVALCMAWLKMARLINSPEHRDSWVDLAGYTGIGAQVSIEPDQE